MWQVDGRIKLVGLEFELPPFEKGFTDDWIHALAEYDEGLRLLLVDSDEPRITRPKAE